MAKLLVLAPAPRSAASTRYRLLQFFPELRDAGIEPTLRPFLDETGFSLLYRSGASAGKLAAAARAIAGRLADLVRASDADAVLIHREAALVGPPVFEWLVSQALRKPVIFDLDDAVWVPYASPTYGATLSRLLKWPQKAAWLASHSTCVLAGNRHVADWAREHGASVEIIPTVVDTDVFVPRRPPRGRTPVLGWIGTHSTAQYLQAIVPALQRLAQRRQFVLRVVGGHVDAPGVVVDERPWSEEREMADFQDLDVGLYPLRDDAWAAGKSGFKAIQYMAAGVPVVASPVGVTTEIIAPGDNGLWAATDDEWVAALERLLGDPASAEKLGQRGRETVVARWSRRVHGPRLVAAARSVIQ